jgi:hypothetical protein
VLLVKCMLFTELVKVEDGWLWSNGRIGSMPKVGSYYFGRLVVEEAKDRMKNIVGGEEPIALCD